MVILRSQNKINDFFMILAWASPFNKENQEHHGVRIFVLPSPRRGSNEIVNRQQVGAIR